MAAVSEKKAEKVYIYLKLNLCTLQAVPGQANGSLNLFSVSHLQLNNFSLLFLHNSPELQWSAKEI